MENFLNKLYSYEYFGTYLMISIAVLLLLFIIILFFGKKDQKHREIEATKKLQQINNADAFKEDSVATNVQTEAQKLENDTIVVTKIEDIPVINNVPETEIQPVINTPQMDVNNANVINNDLNTNNNINNDINSNVNNNVDLNSNMSNNQEPNGVVLENNVVDTPVVQNNPEENIMSNVENNSEPIVRPVINQEIPIENKPLLDKVEEKPFVFNEVPTHDINNINNLETNTVQNPSFTEPVMEQVSTPIPEPVIDIPVNPVPSTPVQPDVNTSSTYKNGPQVFSSVYVPEKEENIEMPKIDLPENREAVSVPTSEELDIELPTLKKESTEPEIPEKVEYPMFNDYNLDDLSGETYTINK